MKSVLAALLFCTASVLGQPLSEADTNALLARIAESRSGHSVQAEFVEKRTLPMWSEPVVEKGTIAFEPPDRFLRKTRNLSLCDGRFLWMYYPEFRQVEKYPLNARGPGQLFSALGQALQFRNIAENFQVSASKLPDGYRLELIPRSGGLRRLLQSITLELDASLRLRSSNLMGRQGDRLETSYTNERILPPGSMDFTFTPPPSATVVMPLGGE
ncbi:MAG: outer membrane lipoprotein carrier protein LolA [Chthoniobacterales bacterium]|nr:outer membrane lipoprotein carrier protein LolA [Chthoniobacterales bacterium]